MILLLPNASWITKTYHIKLGPSKLSNSARKYGQKAQAKRQLRSSGYYARGRCQRFSSYVYQENTDKSGIYSQVFRAIGICNGCDEEFHRETIKFYSDWACWRPRGFAFYLEEQFVDVYYDDQTFYQQESPHDVIQLSTMVNAESTVKVLDH